MSSTTGTSSAPEAALAGIPRGPGAERRLALCALGTFKTLAGSAFDSLAS